jgi:phospholipid/cholesterol/gamma-HCH transport system ATP-binding protein
MADREPYITVRDLKLGYGDFILLRDINFQVAKGEIFVIIGGSGSGKSTLMRHLIGLKEPAGGEILYRGFDFWGAEPGERERMMRHFGVMYQSGALWSSMTLAENIALPLQEYTSLDRRSIAEIVGLKLSLVGLGGFEDYYPSEISGGMKKRAGIARAMALDPEILFLDEPSSGLDPLGARRLDDLILELRESLEATFVVISHDLASIFAIGDNSIFLDADQGTMTAAGPPEKLLRECDDPTIHSFLTRGDSRRGGRESAGKVPEKEGK